MFIIVVLARTWKAGLFCWSGKLRKKMSIRMYCLHFFLYTFFPFFGTYKEQLLRYAIVTYVQKLGETFAEEHDTYHVSYTFSIFYFKLYSLYSFLNSFYNILYKFHKTLSYLYWQVSVSMLRVCWKTGNSFAKSLLTFYWQSAVSISI